MNERITENLVRDILRDKGYYDNPNLIVEEQKSKNHRLNKLLKHASKKGTGRGRPEFIIEIDNDNVIVIECKADIKKHVSENIDQYADYAVDGVLNYMAYLKLEYNVIGIAVSGQTVDELKITNYYQGKGEPDWKIIHSIDNKELINIVSSNEYLEILRYDPEEEKKKESKLIDFSKELHTYMWEHGKLTESEKPLMVSGVLTALENAGFRNAYKHYREEARNHNERAELAVKLYEAIEDGFKEASIPENRIKFMIQPYSFIPVHANLSKSEKDAKHTPLRHIIDEIKEQIGSLSAHNSHDVIGQFYGEFLKYTGGDKKQLGIVLTPRHVCDMFSDLVRLTPESKVVDTCTGTGGFLVSAMAKMLNKAKDEDKDNIKRNGLYGVEMQPNMYSLATSNMFLRGDGKSNLYQGSCFDQEIVDKLKKQDIDYAFINPPYSQKGKDDSFSELSFINHTLNILRPSGTLVAIVPMSCAIKTSRYKEILLSNHTLKAVMSMPNELFYPVGVVTCIMVFEAHIPHADSNKQTWFGYWKDDGFTKTKKNGRIDANNKWNEKKKQWLHMYHEKEVIAGMSAKAYVGPKDEWCCEAYMETDYSDISDNDFMNVLRNYSVFQLLNKEIA